MKKIIRFMAQPAAALQGLIAVSCFIWLFQSSYPDMLCPPQNDTLDPRWYGYNAEDIKQYFDCIGSNGKKGLEHYQYVTSKLDMMFPIVYGLLFFSLMCCFVTNHMAKFRWRNALLVLPFLVVCFDYWENTNTLAFIEQYRASIPFDNKAVMLASFVTQAKTVFFLINALLGLFVAGFWLKNAYA